MKWLMRLTTSVIISLMGGIPLLRRTGTFPVCSFAGEAPFCLSRFSI